MTDDVFDALDPRFENELRAVLNAQGAVGVPQSLRSFVAAVPRRERSVRVMHPLVTRFAALAAAAAVVVAAGAGGLFLLSTTTPPIPISSPSPRPTQSPTAPRWPTPVPSPSAGDTPVTLRFLVNSGGQDPTSQQLQAIVDALTKRVNSELGESDSPGLTVTTDGARSVTVTFPLTWEGWQDLPNISSALAAVGDVEFTPIDAATVEPGATIDPSLPALFSGTAVDMAAVRVDEFGQVSMGVYVDSAAEQTLSAWSAAHVGSTLAVTVDGNLVLAPVIEAPITDGELRISLPTLSGSPKGEARYLAAILDSSPLPFSLTLSSALPTPPTGLFQPGYFQFRVDSGDHVLTSDECKAIVDIVSDRLQAMSGFVTGDAMCADPDRGVLSVTLRRADQDYSELTTAIAAKGDIDFVPIDAGTRSLQPGETVNPTLPAMFSNHDGSPSYGQGATWADNDGGPIITVGEVLNGAATTTFDAWARGHIDGAIALVVDGKIAAEAPVSDQHVEGQITFTFYHSEIEATNELAALLTAGPLPYPLELLTQP